ncbi:uncharacterized protein [Montipora foliosa]|uniref:uncharacterized protein n=1 Tax=Montipora foliosa TaxID=591990 RepID=UPI0035F14A67
MMKNPKTQLTTTEKSQDAATTSKVSHVSSPLQSEKHETNLLNPTKDAKDYSSIPNITITSNVMDSKTIPDGSKSSNASWMIASLVGWAIVVVLFVWLMVWWKRIKKDPKEGDSTRNQPRKQSLPDHKAGDVGEEVTFMNLTEIRSQMSEQEGGYAALNIHRMMRPPEATYTSLWKSENMV